MIVKIFLSLYSSFIIKYELKAHEKNNSINHSCGVRGNYFT